jgi:hypothetical protein
MARKMVKERSRKPATSGLGRYRKVTYSLPESVARELDNRSAGSERGKSRMVAEALSFYFSAQDRRDLAAVYREAADDPQFQADNAAVLGDFAALDAETGTASE